MVDHSTGRSRGFGFVTFESEDAVERVMSDGRMHDLGGKQVTIFLLLSSFCDNY
jgi:heterogeneous nuclear ribonucleoprotein A1/A3